ncbi:DUF4424 domain-containing protein [Methylosinus sporium]|uniref:DUF4424 domain-containing protein n=1 Tax=Methylosinus sporium TaxID=428 RepID=UPI003839F5F6
MRGTTGVFLVTLCLGAAAARANDSTAALTTGGLVLRADADIEMRSEDLSISRERIAVRYRFFNHSAADRTVTVAFPLPEIDFRESVNVSVPDEDSDNFLKFRTLVDGREIVAHMEQKAFLDGGEVGERLRALGVPLQPRAKKTLATLEALPKEVQQKLLKEKLVREDDYDQGRGMEHHVAPEWSLRTSFYWEQTFPAGREIVVEHAYAPSVGGSVQTGVADKSRTPAEIEAYRTRYCPDKSFIAAVAAMTKKNGAPPPEQRIAYVLKTGANWAGPIGDFHLAVDKGDPAALVSFCETGVTKTGPTRFEVHKTDFKPTRDLDILIIDASQ